MEAFGSALALYGLREDLRSSLPPCPMVTALIVQSLFGGKIFRYAKDGFAGSDFVNEIQMGEDEFYRIDLSQIRIEYDPVAFAAEELYRYDLLDNPDTFEEYQTTISVLLKYWQDHCAR